MNYASCLGEVVAMRLVETGPPQPTCQWSFDDDSTGFYRHSEPNFVLELTVNVENRKLCKVSLYDSKFE